MLPPFRFCGHLRWPFFRWNPDKCKRNPVLRLCLGPGSFPYPTGEICQLKRPEVKAGTGIFSEADRARDTSGPELPQDPATWPPLFLCFFLPSFLPSFLPFFLPSSLSFFVSFFFPSFPSVFLCWIFCLPGWLPVGCNHSPAMTTSSPAVSAKVKVSDGLWLVPKDEVRMGGWADRADGGSSCSLFSPFFMCVFLCLYFWGLRSFVRVPFCPCFCKANKPDGNDRTFCLDGLFGFRNSRTHASFRAARRVESHSTSSTPPVDGLGFEPLILVEGKWADHQATNNHQLEGSWVHCLTMFYCSTLRT